jgi:hypothetical protein
MYSCNAGKSSFTKDGVRISSIVDIIIDSDFLLSVFPGNLSDNDILLKYKDYNNNSRLRTPKHIHWVVDLLIKKEKDPTLTNKLLKLFRSSWNNASGLSLRNYNTITKVIYNSKVLNDLTKFNNLNNYGYFSVEFLIILMELLIVQEKTNNPNAYMFGNIIKSLLNNQDLFSIISTATHRGR